MQKCLLGFASGVMLAAMVWSMLMPAMAQSGMPERLCWFPAVVGFFAGTGSLLGLDALLQHAEWKERRPFGEENGTFLMTLAVTLHNLPEGMAVGVALAAVLAEDSAVTLTGAAALSIGIAIQNIPEGTIISAPLAAAGMKTGKAFFCGVLSGAVEPLGALCTLLLTHFVQPLLPYVLAFAAGTMLYVVVVELIPEMQSGQRGPWGALGTAAGFAFMMLLDVALG